MDDPFLLNSNFVYIKVRQRNYSDESFSSIYKSRSYHGHPTKCTFKAFIRPDKIRHNDNFWTSTSNSAHFIILLVSLLFISSKCAISEPHNIHRHDTNNECDIISPMIIQEDGDVIPLFLTNCPTNLRLSIPARDRDDFVIELVKNDRLISENYFKSFNQNKVDQLGSRINFNSKSGPNPDPSVKIDKQDFYHNHKFISLHDIKRNDDHCHYLGILNGDTQSASAISIVESKLLSGFFHYKGYSYHLLAMNATTLLVKTNSDAPFPNNDHLNRLCLHQDHKLPTRYGARKRSRREALSIEPPASRTSSAVKRKKKSSLNNKVIHEPFQRNSSSLFVELLIVHDYNQFREYNGNATLIAERTMQIVNIMNVFYRQLNIFIALVGVVLWTVEDEIKLTEDGDSTLTNFLKYRQEKLLPRYHHDNAQLITTTSFNGSVVGKALKGPICTHDHTGGVNTDHSHMPTIVAVTLSHELGHNLGMEHDEDGKCTCPDQKCIMSSSSSYVHPKHWSSCSLQYIEESRKHGLLDCLINEPEQVFGPICGNGFVEEGEDCDLGEILYDQNSDTKFTAAGALSQGKTKSGQSTYNPCCDRATCKFSANATCAQGPCCDLTKCSVINANETKVCRPRKTECDFEELCDGLSEYCPLDVYYHDGIECGPTILTNQESSATDLLSYNRSRSYCYKGRCASHETQCQLLWGTSGTTSRDICYEQNIHGNTSGNCGYNRKEKIYEICDAQDSLCGMLHCVHNQQNENSRKTGKLDYGFDSASILTVSFFVMSNHERIYCHGAIVDAGPDVRDPGLVPNGASCGEDKMCLNQKCLPVADVVYKDWCPSDCNGNGICDNTGVCHCNDGTVGTSCYQFFGPNFHLSLLLYIIMFFGPMIALILLAANHYRNKLKIWWFLHNRKMALRKKSRDTANHHSQSSQNRRAMAYQAKEHQVSISEPIPLNRQLSQPAATGLDLDPWAETSTSVAPTPIANIVSTLTTPTHLSSATAAAFGMSKPQGYRLEPLPKRPLEPLPPPVPPHQNLWSSSNFPVESKTEESNLRPVRAAPPPPPPPHASQR